MNLTFDPVWPWSGLPDFLGAASLPLAGTLLVCAGLLLAGPGLWPRDDRAAQGRFLRRVGTILAGCLAALVFLGRGLGTELAGVGVGLLMLLPVALVGFTLGTYRGVPGATPTRVFTIAAFRLAAFLLAFFLVLRPSLAFSDESAVGGRVIFALDRSESMTTADAVDNQTRWDYLVKLLNENKAAFESLRQRGLDVEFHSFATGVEEFDLEKPGVADGALTDFGTMLHTLQQRRQQGRPARALVLLSDGADNGTTFLALRKADEWTTPPCPIHAVGLGNPTTVDSRTDLIVTAVTPEAKVVRVKSEFNVNVTVDAPGLKDRTARLRIYLDGEEARGEDVQLREERGNVFTVKVPAPTRPGDVMLKARIEDPRRPGQPLPGELTDRNNEKINFVSVRKEGVGVLLIDRQRAYEPQAIIDALHPDRERISLNAVWLRGSKPLDADAARLFDFAGKQYDVIILGDVTADQVRSIDPQAFESIRKQIDAGAGLLLLGGYSSFGPTWRDTQLRELSPVELGGDGQIERPTKVVPTDDGLRLFGYVMQLGDTLDNSRDAWAKFKELLGANKLTLPPNRELLTVLAQSPAGDPLLVYKLYGKGRVLAFGGDTTHRWVRTPETQALHGRFWRQMVFWLGKQDEASGAVWVLPDSRTLPPRTDQGFTVGVRNKHGVEVPGGTFEVLLKAPDGRTFPLETRPLTEGRHGGRIVVRERPELLAKPGIYELIVTGSATAPDGEKVGGTASSRFVVEDDEVEKSRRAADHEYLKKLAAAGGGKFHLPTDLPKLLSDLGRDVEARRERHQTHWPSWNQTSPQPMRVLTLLLFVAVLAGEWGLRRLWGLA